MSKIIKVDTTLKKIDKQVKSNFEEATVTDVLGALVTTKKMTDVCDNLYKKTKKHIERNITPEDIGSVLEKTPDGKSLFGQVVATETLFGTEYRLGEVKWVINQGNKASRILLDAVNSNPTIKAALDKYGIINYNPTINYKAIHAVVDPLSGKDEIPAELEILRGLCDIVETPNTVLVSTIKDNFKDETE